LNIQEIFSKKGPNIKFYEKAVSGGRVVSMRVEERQTKGESDMPKLMAGFRNFANLPKKKDAIVFT
jgi:hypothetical protein